MTAKPALSGQPCDANHPFPAPGRSDRVDSADYGAQRRGGNTPHDVDLAPTWRTLAAWIWRAPCLDAHIGTLADDEVLTTHLVAAAVMVGLPRNGMIYALALEQVGAADAINAMQAGGLKAAYSEVTKMSTTSRQKMIAECLSLILKGWSTLQLDINDHSVLGVPIGRGD